MDNRENKGNAIMAFKRPATDFQHGLFAKPGILLRCGAIISHAAAPAGCDDDDGGTAGLLFVIATRHAGFLENAAGKCRPVTIFD